MSAGAQLSDSRAQDQAVLGELLHSLSQPLTTLRCSLELSVDEAVGQQQHAVAIALEQTDLAIGVLRLMREYLHSESAPPPQAPIALWPVLRNVMEQLSSVAKGRQIQLHFTSACACAVGLPEPKLRLALQYLVGTLLEGGSRPRNITLRVEEGPLGSVLRAGVEPVPTALTSRVNSALSTLHHVQLLIASRLLESAGASLVLPRNQHSGFTLHIPQPSRLQP